MQYVSAVFLDFDNIYSCLFTQSAKVARSFANEPAVWLDALRNMRGSEQEDTTHHFVVRRCYMNPAGVIGGDGQPFSRFRQAFVRDGWEVIDTPPLTSQGKTSADVQIVMDIMDTIAHFQHVGEYVIMAADADYTPIIIRLRKHMKKTVVYAAKHTSVAYRAACDSIIDEKQFIELFSVPDEKLLSVLPPVPKGEAVRTAIVRRNITVEDVQDALRRYFAESGPGHVAQLGGIGTLLQREFGDEISENWLGSKSLSKLIQRLPGVELFTENGFPWLREKAKK